MLVRKPGVIMINGLFVPYMCAAVRAVIGDVSPGVIRQPPVPERLAADRAGGHRGSYVKGVNDKGYSNCNHNIFAKGLYTAGKYHHKQADKQG